MQTRDNELTIEASRLATSPSHDYHVAELEIALDAANPARALPRIAPGEKVLDIGCGAGQTLIAACAYRVPGTGGLCVSCSRNDCPEWGYGTDVDESAIALGRLWSKRHVLKPGAAESLPFDDGEFDLIIARVSLPYTNIRISAQEMRRVLKPGGRVWLTLHPLSFVLRTAGRNWKGRVFLCYAVLNGLFFHLTLRLFPLLGRYESWQSESAIRRLLLRSGFTNVQVTRSEHHFLVTAEG